jgi:hypothetical protein
MRAVYQLPNPRRRTAKQLRPYARVHNLSMLDGRCAAAICIRDLSRELERHIGGNPTAAQKLLIREASVKNAKLGLLLDRVLKDEALDLDLATRVYLAWSNSLRRDLEALGIARPEQMPQRLADVLKVA